MTAKEYLSQAYRINRVVDVKLNRVRELQELATKATATISPTPTSRTQNVHSMENIIVKMLALRSEICDDIDKLMDTERAIQSAINAVDDVDCRVLLEMRYLSFMSWREIAENLRYSERGIFKLHGRALSKIVIPE